jgi:cbb3-type cytochrome oxidase maturation protein
MPCRLSVIERNDRVDSIYVLIPVTLVLLGLALAAWLWSVSSGQYEDLDKAARSILFDDEPSADRETGERSVGQGDREQDTTPP